MDKGQIIILATYAAGWVFGAITLWVFTCSYWRNWLVRQGHAEYYLDADNQRQWRMKECE